MKAKLVNKLMPFENVEFDFNPEKMTISRGVNNRRTRPVGKEVRPEGSSPGPNPGR